MNDGSDLRSFFSPDFATARGRFVDRAAARGFPLETHPIGGAGPQGEDLTIDVAWAGAAPARAAVVVSSGLHGVEGYFGSAVQLALLAREDLVRSLPRGVALVLVHALNPYGFAWLRRVDQDNVDLNRNFLLPGEAYAGSPWRYATLDPLLNPRTPPRRFDLFAGRSVLALLRHGRAELKQAVAGGQYDFPQGLFYGGNGPARTHEILAAQLGRWIGQAVRIVQLDFHTGLGGWANYQLLIEPGLERSRQEWLQTHFGMKLQQSDPARSIAYHARGDLSLWCRARFPERHYDVLCAEFGTYRPLRMISALRTENQAHFWARDDPAAIQQAKHVLRERFVPESPGWRALSVAQALELIEGSLAACARV